MNDKPVPRKRKKDGGAVLFWAYHNNLQSQLERLDSTILELARSEHETKRRLAAIEHAVKTHSRLIYEDQATIKMFCIACHHEFDVPIAEADDPDFVTTCPICHCWSLPMPEESLKEYSPKMIAEETGFSQVTVCKTIRDLGLRGERRNQLFREKEVKQIQAVLATKKPRKKKPRRGVA